MSAIVHLLLTSVACLQLFGMRYGTVPVAHATGGLRDTIQEFNPFSDGVALPHAVSPYTAEAFSVRLARHLVHPVLSSYLSPCMHSRAAAAD